MNAGKKSARKKLFLQKILLGAIITLILIVVVFNISTGSMQDNGTVTLHVPLAGTSIYIDGTKKTTTQEHGQIVTIDNIKSGAHFVLTNKDGYWPWEKTFDITRRENFSATSFNIKQVPVYSLVPKYTLDKEAGVQSNMYQNILALFDNTILKKISPDKTISIEIKDRNIAATWLGDETPPRNLFCKSDVCDKTFLVLPAEWDVRQVDFYPGRNDLIMFSTEDKVWAIELDRRGTQNVQPIYVGFRPDFVRGTGNSIYIKDGVSLMLINL